MYANKHSTREFIRKLDQRAVAEYAIPSILLMENAGGYAARVIQDKSPSGSVAIFCGKGNNGGDGFVIARHLFNQGREVTVFFIGDIKKVAPDSDPGINLQIIHKMGIEPVVIAEQSDLPSYKSTFDNCTVMVDAIFGTGLTSPIREKESKIISYLRSYQKTVVGIDIPSGLDANTGEILGIVWKADYTITFGLPKIGFIKQDGPKVTGDVFLGDISIPRQLMEEQ